MCDYLCLDDFKTIRKVETDENTVLFEVIPANEEDVCQKCGSINTVFNGKTTRYVRDLPMFGREVQILITQRRILCRNCGETSRQHFTDIDEKARITSRLRNKLKEESLIYPFAEVARRYGVSEKTVRKLFSEYVAEKEKSFVRYSPRVLGIDEVHLNGTMRFVAVDVERHGLIEILKSRSKKSVMEYLCSLPDNHKVSIVTMDMWKPYKEAVYESLPQAKIVIDRFHVVKMVTAALETIRKDYARALSEKERIRLKNSRWLMLHNKEDLLQKQTARLEEMLNAHPTLKDAYELKESFRSIYQCEYREDAEKQFKNWATIVPAESAYKEVIATVKRWDIEIFNYFDYRYTNGVVESLNNLIKEIEKRGKGYNFDVLRAKALFSTRATQKPKYKRKPSCDIFNQMNIMCYTLPLKMGIEHGSYVDIDGLMDCVSKW